MTPSSIIEKATSDKVLNYIRSVVRAHKSARKIEPRITPILKKIISEYVKENSNSLDLAGYIYEMMEIEIEINKQFDFIMEEGFDFIENHSSVMLVIDIVYATLIAQIYESGAGVSFDDAFKKVFHGIEKLKITDFLARLQGIMLDELDLIKSESQLKEIFSRAVILENRKISILMSA